jgi:hypothetical protein
VTAVSSSHLRNAAPPGGWRGMVGRRPSRTTGSDVVREVGWSSFEFSFAEYFALPN